MFRCLLHDLQADHCVTCSRTVCILQCYCTDCTVKHKVRYNLSFFDLQCLKQHVRTLQKKHTVLEQVSQRSPWRWRNNKHRNMYKNFDGLLTVHLSIFISVINQLGAHIFFYNKFYFLPLHVSSTCAHHQEVKIALHSLWYHHIYRWPSGAQVERGYHTLCNAILNSWWLAHVLEKCRCMK